MNIWEIPLLLQTLAIASLLGFMIFLLGLLMLPDAEADNWLTRLFNVMHFRRTRLAQLLKDKHVDVNDYANTLSLAELRTQCANCNQCANFWFCDKQRKAHRLSHGDLAFCPNRNRKPLSQILQS